MPANAIRTQGTSIEIEHSDTPGTFIKIGRCVSFDGPGGKAAIIDTTDLDSTAKEKLPGLPDEGSFSLVLNYNSKDNGQKEMQAARTAQALRHFRVTFTDTGKAEFDAYVMEWKLSGRQDSKVEANATLEITGAVTYTAAP